MGPDATECDQCSERGTEEKRTSTNDESMPINIHCDVVLGSQKDDLIRPKVMYAGEMSEVSNDELVRVILSWRPETANIPRYTCYFFVLTAMRRLLLYMYVFHCRISNLGLRGSAPDLVPRAENFVNPFDREKRSRCQQWLPTYRYVGKVRGVISNRPT